MINNLRMTFLIASINCEVVVDGLSATWCC